MKQKDPQKSAPSGGGISDLLTGSMTVVNVGLEGFVDDLLACGVRAVHVEWVPPANGDPKMAALLAKLGV